MRRGHPTTAQPTAPQTDLILQMKDLREPMHILMDDCCPSFLTVPVFRSKIRPERDRRTFAEPLPLTSGAGGGGAGGRRALQMRTSGALHSICFLVFPTFFGRKHTEQGNPLNSKDLVFFKEWSTLDFSVLSNSNLIFSPISSWKRCSSTLPTTFSLPNPKHVPLCLI